MDLPSGGDHNFKECTAPLPAGKPIPNHDPQTDKEKFNEMRDLVDALHQERLGREREIQMRRDSEAKYQQLSSRISTLENIIQSKDNQIQTLLNEKKGNVLVEENLLCTIEESFSKFQGKK